MLESGQLTLDKAHEFREAVIAKMADDREDAYLYYAQEIDTLNQAINLGDKYAALDLWFKYASNDDRATLMAIHGLLGTNRDQGRVHLALGEAFYYGIGIERSEADALKHFILSHSLNQGDARNYIEEIYSDHGCVDQAYVWAYIGGNGIDARLIFSSSVSDKPKQKERLVYLQQKASQLSHLNNLSSYDFDPNCNIDVVAKNSL